MPTPPRVLFVGLDAAEHTLLARWAAEGLLPNVQALMTRAARGIVKNSPGFYVGSVWPSFWTGLRPAKHMRYCYRQLRAGSYEVEDVSPSDVRAEAFWEPLSRAGRRVAVIDVPKSRLARELRGVQLVDWATHDPDGPTASAPPSLARELLSSFGENPMSNCNGTRRTLADYQRLCDLLRERAERKGKAIAQLLEADPWDLFLAVFAEPHCVGHQCWQLHDPTHPGHEPALAAALGDPFLDLYRALDLEIGNLLRRLGPESYAFIMSSHGMGPHYDANHLLDRVLLRLQGRRGTGPPDALAVATKRIWDRLPRALKAPLRRARGPLKSRLERAARDVSGDGYFQVPNNDHYGAVRVNVIGREPQGIVQKGAEYEAVCARLVEDLAALENLDTGRPAARRVVRTRDLYPEDDVSELPDVLVEWSREAPLWRIGSPRIGEVSGATLKTRTGDHLDEGIFFALGPGIRPGALDAPVAMEDFAPTIASLLGVELPASDGRDLMPRLRG